MLAKEENSAEGSILHSLLYFICHRVYSMLATIDGVYPKGVDGVGMDRCVDHCMARSWIWPTLLAV